jgi:asparagine synthase (glutamine-hydrolysing)
MCGIVGVIGDFSRDECREIVGRMNRALEHRGPDDEGVWCEDGFGFGMRRLSIIDLAGGHQPMSDEASGLRVVMNGEIYNYRLLRDDLLEDGVSFSTSCDTEVALKSLARNGLEAVHTWNGMFAVAAWDGAKKKLSLLRDRVGVKPLYYFWDGRTLLFASELKAIMASGIVDRLLDQQAIWDYLTFRYVPGPNTVWQGIRKLPPGCLLEYTVGSSPQEVRYWSSDVVSDEKVGAARSERQADEEFASLFLDAVQLRLIASDVPVGVLLSGGLDSGAVAAAAVELGHRNFHTFSVGFDEGGSFTELPYAREVAKHVGAQYHEVIINQDEFMALLPEVVYSADEPLADLASVPLLAVCRLARQDVKVVLSGEGSDEILAGYNFDQALMRWDRARALQSVPQPLLHSIATGSRLLRSERIHSKLQKLAGTPLAKWNALERTHMTRFWLQSEKQELWPAGNGDDSDRILDADYARARSLDPLQQALAVYQKSWLVEDLLMKADKMSMATSLELRTPFLDYRLVEWANRQPNSVKVKRTGRREYTTKSVLRRFCASRLPDSIIKRPKQGFPVPAYLWLQGPLNDWASETLMGEGSRIAKAFRPEPIRKLVTDARLGHPDAAQRVWMLAILELWLQAWKVDLDVTLAQDRTPILSSL